jgi:DNA-directed RNA polymerase subunit E'/Rpb7
METTTVTRRLCLHPSALGPGIRASLLAKAKESYKGECTKRHGYMLSIDKVLSIVDNSITTANTNAVFNVKFQVNVLKPREGKKYGGVICMVTTIGIFVKVEEHLKVLIPRTALVGFSINNITAGSSIAYEKDDVSYTFGSDIDIIITKMQYDGGKYSCIGRVLEDKEIEDGTESEEADESDREKESDEDIGEDVAEEEGEADTDDEDESAEDEDHEYYDEYEECNDGDYE